MRASFYAIVQFEDERMCWPVFFTCPTGPTLAVFSTRGLAERFYYGRGYSPPWELARMRDEDLRTWLRGNQNAGVNRVMVDPGPEAEVNRSVEIVEILARLSD